MMRPRISRGGRRVGPPPAVALTAISLLLTLVLAACGGTASQPSNQAAAAASAAAEPQSNPQGGGQPSSVPFADLAERKIVKTGEITLEVQSVAAAVGEVRATAVALGGYVGDSRAGAADDPATLTLRIPAERFEDALARLRDMDGEVRAEATGEVDATSSIVDLEARIRNLEASERQYRALVDRAAKVEEILSVQSRLDDVRGQIEQHRAQLAQLNGLAALSTLTVTLVPVSRPIQVAAEGWDPGATLDAAVATLVGVGQGVTDLLIWLAIVVLPLVLVTGVVLVLALRFGSPIRRRLATAPVAEDQPPGPG
jgi:hypothetical protein